MVAASFVVMNLPHCCGIWISLYLRNVFDKITKISCTKITIPTENIAQFHRWLSNFEKNTANFVKSCSKCCWHTLKLPFNTFCDSYKIYELEYFCCKIVFWKYVRKKYLFFTKLYFASKKLKVIKILTFAKRVENVLKMILATRGTSFYIICLRLWDKFNAAYGMEHVFLLRCTCAIFPDVFQTTWVWGVNRGTCLLFRLRSCLECLLSVCRHF